MKKLRKFFRMATVFCLIACMMLAMLPASFADEQLTYEQILIQQQEEAERLRKKKAEEERLAAELAAQQAAQLAAQQAAFAVEPSAEEPVLNVEQPVYTEPVYEVPVYEEAVYEEPANTEPNVEEPICVRPEEAPIEELTVEPEAVAERAIEEPAVEEPSVEEPAVEEPAVEEPTVEEPTVEEPAVEEPTIEEPTVEEPAVEEPTVEEPAVEEPAVEEPAVEEPAVEEPAVEEPPVEEPTVEPAEEESSEDALLTPVEEDEHAEISTDTVDDAEVAEKEFDDNSASEPKSASSDIGEIAEAAEKIWMAAGQLFESVQQAIDHIFSTDPTATEATVELTKSTTLASGISVSVAAGKSVIVNLAKKTLNVLNGIAAKVSGNGSVTLENGTITSQSETAPVVQTSVDNLTVKNMTITGDKDSSAPVLDINGGNVNITGSTNIVAGRASKVAVDVDDSVKSSNVYVNTSGIVQGSVTATNWQGNGHYTRVTLHNGFFKGKVSTDNRAVLTVDGGDYTNDVAKYLDPRVNYAAIINPYYSIYSVGGNIGWSALRSSMCAPTCVNILRSPCRSICLPGGVMAKNSTGWAILVNGRPLLKGGITAIPGCRHACCCKSGASVVDGANSIWYKGCEDGLTYEISGNVSYVTVDGVKVKAVIDGVFAELEAETLEELSSGTHIVRFVLPDGSIAATNLKVVPDEKVEWTKGSKNGLQYEMTGKISKVLIDHVKVDASISGKNASLSASVLQDLKTGKHTVEFVLENNSHVVTSITVK